MARKRKPVATGVLCSCPVEVYFRNGWGANYNQNPGGPCRIYLGTANNDWKTCGAPNFLHEVVEFACGTLGLRYDRWPSRSNDSGDCSFHMDHAEFSWVMMQVGVFLTEIFPALSKARKEMARGEKK